LTLPLEDPGEASIGDLFHRLVDDGGDLVRAEISLYRQIALYRVGKASGGIAAVAGAAILGLAAVTTLLVMLAQGLAVKIGPVGAGLVVAAVAGIIAFLLLRYGIEKMKALSGDDEERAALKRGERA
jgi:hypothetical protein